MKDKPLIITATHGDEQFSIPLIKKLEKQYSFDWIIGNQKAIKNNKRFLEVDMNRSAPGNIKSKIYEIRRVAEIIKLSQEYRVTIDIHGTFSDCGLFIILSDPSWENIELSKKFNIKNVLLWPNMKPTGPLTQIIRPGLEIECGPKDSKNTIIKLEKVLKTYLSGQKPSIKKKYYIVTGKIKGENDPTLQDFIRTDKYGQSFYPILADNRYPNITCYKAQKLLNTL